ncbi:MAG: OmpA family protein [Chitinophagales bacterium]|nr:OmpA family protein [Chitinophagales bacterium]
MKNILLLILFFLLGAHFVDAQPIRKSSYEMTLRAAREAYATQDHVNALDRYVEAYEEKQDRSLLDTIAFLQFRVRDYRSAERYFARILRRDKENKLNDYRYVYGQLLKMNEKYSEAIDELQKFLATASGDSIRTLTKNAITGAELAQELPPNLKGVTVENAGKSINSKTSEYTPSVSGNGKEVYFTSRGVDDVTYVDLEGDGKDEDGSYAKVFVAMKDDTGWEKPKELGGEVNRQKIHNSNVAVAPDGRTLFFTRAALEGNVLSESKIYYSSGGSESWKGAEEVKGINGDYVAKHPAPGELFGKQVLFFSSNMDGGYGGYDLYYATRLSDGEYDDPVNLGATINGPGDEETPHYREGTLYFSSDGHPGLGGFDIFYSIWDGSSWSAPLNMGRGYNTSVDDYGLTLDKEGYFGMLASNRPGGKSAYGRTCCDDLYQVDIDRVVVDLLVGLFTDAKKPLTGGTVHLVPVQNNKVGDPTSQSTGDDSNVTGFDLELDMPYMVIATHPDYYPDTVQFNTVGVTESTSYEERMYLSPKPVPPPVPEYDTITLEEPIVMENILYDFDDDRIRDEAESDLQYIYELMTEHADMKIELSSHTDKEGNDDYNEDLSQRRAESARRWLVRKGLDRDRIVAKGYGETQPQTVNARNAALHDFLNEGDVLTEEFVNALETEEQQDVADQLNRRTEFKILEGPTTITIQTTRLRKKESTKDSNDRGSMIGAALKGQPVMQFNERLVDFGKVKKGEKRRYTFDFVNTGNADLTIDLISACDCTSFVSDPSGETFKPGEKGKIEFIFDSSEKEESEVIDIDIFLAQNDKNGNPIIEMVQYKFELVK